MKIYPYREGFFDIWLKLRMHLWPYHMSETLESEMMEILNHMDKNQIFFCFDENVCTGFIEVSIKEQVDFLPLSKIGYIEGWYVTEEYRRQGIGKRLVNKAQKWIKSQGSQWIASDTTEDYPISPKAHLSLGFQLSEKPLHYIKRIA